MLGTNPFILTKLGLKPSIGADGSTFENSNGRSDQSLIDLIRFGADWEDSRGALQALRHFYNPVDGSKLLPVIGETSPDWALEDRGLKDGQPYSYRLMRRNFHKALTEPAKSDRDAAWGLTFQTMGHVMHHLQDMAQPQHVRADFHCDLPYCRLLGSVIYSPSVYEKYVQQKPPDFAGYPAVYSKDDLRTFKTPRMFWHTNEIGGQATGKGIAEFTNHNFISAGTNFDKPNLFPSPRIGGAFGEEIQIADLCAELGPPCNTLGLKGIVKFFGNQVIDNFTEQTTNNPRMTTLSVFDKFLDRQGKKQVFSYNRANADAAAKLLVPRAVGYSAGMINYFFRGDVNLFEDVAQPGTYAIRNSGPDAIRGRFQLCYDYDSPTAADNRACFKTWTDIALDPSGEINVGTFEPPTSPTPKKPGEYMLVFNGDMGGEKATDFGGIGAVTARQVTLNPPLIFFARRDQEDTSQESYGYMEFGMFLTEAMWSAMRSNPSAFTVVAETANQRYEMPASTDTYSTECGLVPYKGFIGACASQGGKSTQLFPNGQQVGWGLIMNRNNEFVVTSKFDFTVPILLGNKPEDLATKPIETVCAGLFRYASYLYLNSYTTTGQVKIRLLFQKDATAVKVPLFEFTVAPGSTPVDQTYGANLSGLKGIGRAPVHCGVGLLP